MLTSFLAAAALSTTSIVHAFSPDPGQGKMYIGMWPDIAEGFYDTPAAANARLGINFPVFQLAQTIPLPAYNWDTGAGGEALFSEVDASATDAAYFITVYPDTEDGIEAVTDGDLVQLADQIARYQSQGRHVFLRWAPEMNGPWKSYGVQPTAFKALWERMHTIVKQIAPDTTIVWAPNTSYGYPSGVSLDDASVEDQQALDTDGDGQLTAADDAYAPYYPGDDLVDQAGMSVYYKGPGFQNENEAQPGGFCANLLEGHDPFYNQEYTPFYATYCEEPERVCMFSEAGAAYHVNVTSGVSELELQSAWINDCLANATFFNSYSWLRQIQLFEHAKYENDGGVEDYRDFRVTNNTDVLQAFQEALEALPDRYIWANSTLDDTTSANTEIPTSPASSPNGAATSTDVLTISGLSNEVVTATITELETPTYSGGMANLESESTDQSKADNDQVLHEDPDDDDSSAPGTITSFGLGFTAVFATVLFS